MNFVENPLNVANVERKMNEDEKDFEEYALKIGIPPWYYYTHKLTWLEARRTLREKQKEGKDG